MATQSGYEPEELTWAQRDPQTIMLNDGARVRKTDTGYVIETLQSDLSWVTVTAGSGLSPGAIAVGSDYTPTSTNYEILVDASAGDVVISLLPATGSSRMYHIKKIDDSANVVTVNADGTDLIDDSTSVVLSNQWADCSLIDGALGLWDNVGSSSGQVTVIDSGTITINPGAIASGAVSSAITAVATGALSTDVIDWTPNADISAVTGYAPVTTGGVILYPYPTADTVNFKVGNPTSSSITPGSITLNWRIIR